MIPPVSELIAACEYLARRFGWERPLRQNLIRKLHADATRLARLPKEEPAALFYAFSRPLDLIAEDYTVVPLVLATNQATRLGYRLNASGADLVTLKREVSAGLHSFDVIRRWFAERLVPLPS